MLLAKNVLALENDLIRDKMQGCKNKSAPLHGFPLCTGMVWPVTCAKETLSSSSHSPLPILPACEVGLQVLPSIFRTQDSVVSGRARI